VQTDDFGFTMVDLKKLTYQNEPFNIAEQAKQVFYVQDSCDERWSVVLGRQLASAPNRSSSIKG